MRECEILNLIFFKGECTKYSSLKFVDTLLPSNLSGANWEGTVFSRFDWNIVSCWLFCCFLNDDLSIIWVFIVVVFIWVLITTDIKFCTLLVIVWYLNDDVAFSLSNVTIVCFRVLVKIIFCWPSFLQNIKILNYLNSKIDYLSDLFLRIDKNDQSTGSAFWSFQLICQYFQIDTVQKVKFFNRRVEMGVIKRHCHLVSMDVIHYLS